MAISVNPLTHVISIPRTDLTLDSGTLYTYNTNTFRLALKSWEASIEGIPHPKTHLHNTEITIAGVTYARTIEVIAPYTVTFEDGQYSVILEGSNNNIWDVGGGILNQNQVQVIPTNSVGLQVVSTGSGLASDERTKLMSLPDEEDIWDEAVETGYSAKQVMRLVAAALAGKVSGAGTTNIIFRDLGDSTDRIDATVDENGNRSAVTTDVS